MYTAAGLRFLRTLAARGERVPAYLLPHDEPRGGQHHNTAKTALRRTATAHARAIPR